MKHVILIPTYNEAENIERVISRILEQYPHVYIRVIDDNSPDGTGAIVERLALSSSRVALSTRAKKEGLGKAYVHGFKEVMTDSLATHVIMMDADLSHNPDYLASMIEKSAQYDVVVGSRYVSTGDTVGWEMWRKMLSYWGNIYARAITRMPVHDLTGGFNCIKISAFRSLNLDQIDSSGYAFQIELKYFLYSAHFSITEIPIVFVNRTGGESKISNHIVSEALLAPWRMIFKKHTVENSLICPLCGSSATALYAQKNNHDVYSCASCGFLFVSPLPESVEVYDASYFSGAEKGFGYVDYDADKVPMIPTFNSYLELIKRAGIEKGTLLDIGAATGFFMSLAQEKGFEVSGIEVSDYAAEKGRKKGLNIQTGELALFPQGTFDVVTMLDVIEHTRNPKATLLEARRLLKIGGLLVINTPDAGSLVARTFGKRWHLIVPPEHLHYFSKKNMTEQLRQMGFEICVETTIGKQFTFKYIFKTLYAWQGFIVWKWLQNLFSYPLLSKMYIPLNLGDNMFVIARKI